MGQIPPKRWTRIQAKLALYIKPVKQFWHSLPSKAPWRNHTNARQKPGVNDILWISLLRLIAVGALLTGLACGSIQRTFSFNTSKIFGSELSVDLQLSLLGLLNKVLDILLIGSLENSASMLLTSWMTSPATTSTDPNVALDPPGATFSDFCMREELTKPWITLMCFRTRWRRFGWNFRSFGRFLLCLTISVCVLLQGLAVNTIAIPKQRWFPNIPDGKDAVNKWQIDSKSRKLMTIVHPKTYLKAAHWQNYAEWGQQAVGSEGNASYDLALGMSASDSFIGLKDLVRISGLTDKGWQTAHRNDFRWTGLYTVFNDTSRPIETLSAVHEQVRDLFDWLRDQGHPSATSSTGWYGNVTLAVPSLSTECGSNDVQSIQNSINVTLPTNMTTGTPSFSIALGPVHAMNFTGAKCTLTFRQAFAHFEVWWEQKKDISINLGEWPYKVTGEYKLALEETKPFDYDITTALAIQARDTIPAVQNRVRQTPLLHQFLLMGRRLQHADPAIGTDMRALSIILGVLHQNFLTVSNKEFTAPGAYPSANLASFPVRWQTYGSGPRLPWQWTTVIILGVVLLCFLFGIWQTVWHWMRSGRWLELDGMMMLAQTSPKLDHIEDEKMAREMVYWVADEAGGTKTVLKSQTR